VLKGEVSNLLPSQTFGGMSLKELGQNRQTFLAVDDMPSIFRNLD